MTNTPGDDDPRPGEEPHGESGPSQPGPSQPGPSQPGPSRPEQPAPSEHAGQTPPEEPGYWEQQARRQQEQGGGQSPGQPTVPYPQAYPPPGHGPGYPPGYPQGPVQYAPDHPRATMSLVLGILGVVACQVLGPIAWWMGKKTLEEIDSSGGRYGGRGAAQAGYVMGVVGTVLLGLALLFLVVYVVFFVAIIGGSMTTSGIG